MQLPHQHAAQEQTQYFMQLQQPSSEARAAITERPAMAAAAVPMAPPPMPMPTVAPGAIPLALALPHNQVVSPWPPPQHAAQKRTRPEGESEGDSDEEASAVPVRTRSQVRRLQAHTAARWALEVNSRISAALFPTPPLSGRVLSSGLLGNGSSGVLSSGLLGSSGVLAGLIQMESALAYAPGHAPSHLHRVLASGSVWNHAGTRIHPAAPPCALWPREHHLCTTTQLPASAANENGSDSLQSAGVLATGPSCVKRHGVVRPQQHATKSQQPMHMDALGPWYRVERLLASRRKPSGREFLVRWHDYGAEADSWEPEMHILDKELIRAFNGTSAAGDATPRPSGRRHKPRSLAKSRLPRQAAQAGRKVAPPFLRPTTRLCSVRLGSCHQAVVADEPNDERPEPTLIVEADLARHSAEQVAAMLTATAFGPLSTFAFVAPCDVGLGLFARVALKSGQFVSEYSGPRLPLRLQVRGQYVLQVPGLPVVVDGACENSPFEIEHSSAIYANHSSQPNARIESWPVPRAGPFELQQHLMIVATESIDAGQEVRIDYEGGGNDSYWAVLGQAPVETDWRRVRVQPPPPPCDELVCHRLLELETAASLRQVPPPCSVPASRSPIPWDGASGGDARLHAIVPMLSSNGREANQSAWPLVSTHVPGRTGRECKDRWEVIQHLDEHSGWVQRHAVRAGSHAEAAAELICANQAAASAAAAAAESSDDENVEGSMRCCISGCKTQLLSCSGQTNDGSVEGCHILCAPCLYRWLASETVLREGSHLGRVSRRNCPVCKAPLRAAHSAVRGNAERYVMSLLKIAGTW